MRAKLSICPGFSSLQAAFRSFLTIVPYRITPPNLVSQQLFQDIGCFLPLSPWLWVSSYEKCFDFCSILSLQSFAESSSSDSLRLELLIIIIFFKLCQLLSVALDLHDVVSLLCASQPFVHSQCSLLKCNLNLS